MAELERDPELLKTFVAEVRGHVARLRSSEATKAQRERSAHGVRGAAATVGASELESRAKALEAAIGASEEGELAQDLVDSFARLEAELEAAELEVAELEVAELEVHFPSGASSIEGTGDAEGVPLSALAEPAYRTVFEGTDDDEWDPETTQLLRSLFRQEADEHLEVITSRLLRVAEDPAAIQEALRRAHTLKGSAGTVGYVCMQRAAHQLEERLVQLRDGKLRVDDDIIDVLLGACDLLRPMTTVDTLEAAEELLERFGGRLGELAQPTGATEKPRGGTSTREVPITQAAAEERPERRIEDLHVIRVDVERIDELMNAVGQLVIDRTRVERRVDELRGLTRDLAVSRHALFNSVAGLGRQDVEAVTRLTEIDAELADMAANLERATAGLSEDSDALRRTTRQLQEQLTRVRMMSIHWLFARLSRPLRELCRASGKQVELKTAGESTEMDRSVLDKITDPLIHIVRNAVAHGIETPAARRAAGKAETGVIRVAARHQGEFVFIEVEDDGGGIDPARLREALAEWGQLDADPFELSDDEVLDCVFLSGFSTRSSADSLAGRGVGLDVVRRNVSSLGGDIRVTSTLGEGTRLVIRLPLTTAITQALLFREGEVVYAIPVAHVVSTLVASATDVREGAFGLSELRSRGGGWIPILWLHELLGVHESPESDSLPRRAMVVLSFGKGNFALGCRKVIGPREIVLKRLGALLSRVPLFAGATVSGGGGVQLVLDVSALDELVQRGLRLRRRVVLPSVRQDRMPQKRILLADDSRAIREAVGLILRGAGYLVDVAADGWDAWERLRRRPFDLLLTDLEMPRIDGYELISRCRASAELAALPIMVLTSRTAEKNRRVAEEVGANAFLAKPVNRRVILEQVAALLQ